MQYMNMVIGRDSKPWFLHLILQGVRLCQREDPLPTEFIHYPSSQKGAISLCAECESRLQTIIANNLNHPAA